jgi:hypothetical protein
MEIGDQDSLARHQLVDHLGELGRGEQGRIAREWGLNPTTFSLILRAMGKPDRTGAGIIEEKTGGIVKVLHWDQPPPKNVKRSRSKSNSPIGRTT